MLFTAISYRFNLLKKTCLDKHNNSLKPYIRSTCTCACFQVLLYFIIDLSLNRNGLRGKQKKFCTRFFSDFVFPWNIFGSAIILKIKVLFVIQYHFAYFLLVLTHLFIEIIVCHAIPKIWFFLNDEDTINLKILSIFIYKFYATV